MEKDLDAVLDKHWRAYSTSTAVEEVRDCCVSDAEFQKELKKVHVKAAINGMNEVLSKVVLDPSTVATCVAHNNLVGISAPEKNI